MYIITTVTAYSGLSQKCLVQAQALEYIIPFMSGIWEGVVGYGNGGRNMLQKAGFENMEDWLTFNLFPFFVLIKDESPQLLTSFTIPDTCCHKTLHERAF